MRLLAVLSFPDTDELEVHLILEGRRTIGRAPASRGLVAALDATLAAVREFGFPLTPTPRWVRAVEPSEEEALIAVALDEAEPDSACSTGSRRERTPPMRPPGRRSTRSTADREAAPDVPRDGDDARGRLSRQSASRSPESVATPFSPYQTSWPTADTQNTRRLSRPVPARTRS